MAAIREDERSYKHILVDAAGGPQQFQPRNPRQVKYLRSSVANAKKMGNDSLVTLHEIAYMVPNFVWSISTFPDLTVIFGLDCLLTELASCDKILLSYDTTFLLGDFYLSVLVGKFSMFNECPCMPLAFLLHDRKFEIAHADFFTRLPARFPAKNDVVIVTDGELAMSKAITKALPQWHLATCSNHILTDVELWLKKRSASHLEISVYKCQLQELLHCDSEHQLAMKINTLKPTWTDAFLTYFDSHLKCRLDLAYTGYLKSVGLPDDSITTNMSESLNAVIKRFQDWEEAPIDSIVMAMYKLQLFYVTEMKRSRQGFGPYTLLNQQLVSPGSNFFFINAMSITTLYHLVGVFCFVYSNT